MGIVSHEFEQNIFKKKKITALREKSFQLQSFSQNICFYPKT